jgi:hypothetical protein
LRLLKEDDQEVKVKGFDYHGKPVELIMLTRKDSIFYDGGKTFIKTFEGVEIELKTIKAIKHQATRFSPMMIFEEVNWNE